MSVVFQTVVAVPKDFIEKVLEETFNWKLGISAKLESNQFCFLSKNYHNPGIEKMKEFSKQHQDAVFEAATYCDIDPSIADIYSISNGKIISHRQDLWYDFIYDPIIKSQIDSVVIQEFETEARDYFNMVDNYLRRKHDHEQLNDVRNNLFSTMDFYFETENAIFITKRKDRNHLDVRIEITGNEDIDKPEDRSEEEYPDDGLPF